MPVCKYQARDTIPWIFVQFYHQDLQIRQLQLDLSSHCSLLQKWLVEEKALLTWDGLGPGDLEAWRAMARAAIEKMRRRIFIMARAMISISISLEWYSSALCVGSRMADAGFSRRFWRKTPIKKKRRMRTRTRMRTKNERIDSKALFSSLYAEHMQMWYRYVLVRLSIPIYAQIRSGMSRWLIWPSRTGITWWSLGR